MLAVMLLLQGQRVTNVRKIQQKSSTFLHSSSVKYETNIWWLIPNISHCRYLARFVALSLNGRH